MTYTSSLPPMKMPVTFLAASMQAEAHSATEQVKAWKPKKMTSAPRTAGEDKMTSGKRAR